MKIRTGFVSNSSSSSFVVHKMNQRFDSGKRIQSSQLTPTQEKALEEFGFIKTYINSTYAVPFTRKDWDKEQKRFQREFNRRVPKGKNSEFAEQARQEYTWAYSLICNQDDVLNFLIEQKIPFEALVHYEHESYFYEPDKDSLVIAQNFGNQFSMHPVSKETTTMGHAYKEPVKFHVASKWLEQNQY